MNKPVEYNAAAYAWIIPYLQTVCREKGYAIGVHGSMHRDLDFIAMPWTEEAVSDVELIEAIRKAVQGTVLPDGTEGGRWSTEENKFVKAIVRMPEIKPHGRIAWNVHLTGGLYLDISVMPRNMVSLPKMEPARIDGPARVEAEAKKPFKCSRCLDTGRRQIAHYGPTHVEEDRDYVPCECQLWGNTIKNP